MKQYPEDFNGQELQNKLDNNIEKCMEIYRTKIYNGFKHANTNFFKIQIGKEFTSAIHYRVNVELGVINLVSEIMERKEIFITGGENDPDSEEFDMRYLVVRPYIY